MAIDPVLRTALSGPVAHPFKAVEVIHPYKTFRLLDGLGFLNIGGNVYVGHDPDIGGLSSLRFSEEGAGEEAPDFQFGIAAINETVAIALCQPSAQGSIVKAMWGAFDPATGLVVGAPYVQFVGRIDVPTRGVLMGDAVSFECVSGFDAFFEIDQGRRLSFAFHNSIFPGDVFLQYVVDVGISTPWGRAGTRPALTKAVLP
ncbi:hypothetical protein [Asticcacaulis excentricus]|uniref:Uncharacterized protein n=1 Tax=Asticcacaulis excentricus (strain ATCC 15261 / DSM 4724 / KCTC 12464 / NCIMB 9791 / VKM B-1370 / CB 48) TaxID=573065 RepID=E8RPR4_ASTEC|nr:hypothetical protein [Asticcacaulis excentricus]ADU12041.1 hypothetical protein Astex_0343 [Asticcacaulis excentricus CB 48]